MSQVAIIDDHGPSSGAPKSGAPVSGAPSSRARRRAVAVDAPGDVSGAKPPPSMRRAGLILAAAFWLGYLAHASAVMAMEPIAAQLQLLVRRLAAISVGIGLSVVTHFIVMSVDGPLARRALVTAGCTALAWIVFCMANAALFYAWPVGTSAVAPHEAFVMYLLQFAWIFMAFTGAYIALMATMDLQAERERTAIAMAQANQAQLNMLRYQLNPHFLFNTLNAISTLVLDRRNAEAEKMLLRLSRFLRHTVDADAVQKSSLSAEAAMQREYLIIEGTRFGDRLHCHCDLPGDLGDCLVPSLLLQPIVENAIKYAIAPKTGEAHLWLGGRAENGRLILTVEDDGPGLPPSLGARAGVGWRNTRERLATMYGGAAEMRILKGLRGGGVLVELDMPLERGPPLATDRAPAAAAGGGALQPGAQRP
ncbi:MAG: histidine kinase [Hyphomonadaceae bacterium]|nr:histidine kinase [Hyphomonadaceae bacterium]